jgi:hypothetical protein
MRGESVRLYYVAVSSNILALAILLWGMVHPLKRREQVLAVMLTGISTVCWLRYFRKLNQ